MERPRIVGGFTGLDLQVESTAKESSDESVVSQLLGQYYLSVCHQYGLSRQMGSDMNAHQK